MRAPHEGETAAFGRLWQSRLFARRRSLSRWEPLAGHPHKGPQGARAREARPSPFPPYAIMLQDLSGPLATLTSERSPDAENPPAPPPRRPRKRAPAAIDFP